MHTSYPPSATARDRLVKFLVSDEEWSRLSERAKAEQRSMSELIRVAVLGESNGRSHDEGQRG